VEVRSGRLFHQLRSIGVFLNKVNLGMHKANAFPNLRCDESCHGRDNGVDRENPATPATPTGSDEDADLKRRSSMIGSSIITHHWRQLTHAHKHMNCGT
jgi:hypothetical protein